MARRTARLLAHPAQRVHRPIDRARAIHSISMIVEETARREFRLNGEGQTTKRGGRARPVFSSLRSTLATLVATLALFAQLLAISYPHTMAAPGSAKIIADLRAVFGDTVVLCTQVDDKGAPLAPAGPSGHRAEDCPLCQFAAQTARLLVPPAPVMPALAFAGSETLGIPPDLGALRPSPTAFAQPRAPPFAG